MIIPVSPPYCWPVPNPLELFEQAYQRAKAANADWPEACCLSTADAAGRPAGRMVLFRVIEPSGPRAGVSFFTNYESNKAADLGVNPFAAICVYWHPIQTQVRLSGRVERSTTEESDAYFAGRPRGSQIGSWASDQSRPLDDFETLVARTRAVELQYEGRDVPRPPNWGGFRLIVDRVEFWTEGPFRLHRRELFTKSANGDWATSLLNP